MNAPDVYGQRRQVIASQVRDLIDLRAPHTPGQKGRLAGLIEEHHNLAHEEHRFNENEAFSAFLRRGRDGVTIEQKAYLREARDMGETGFATGVATGAGALVPLNFANKVTSAMKDSSNLLALANVVDFGTGAPTAFPTDSDCNIAGELLPEGSQATEADINNPAQVILGSYKLSSRIILLSRELLTDSRVDVYDYLARQVGIRIGRVLSQFGTTGSGNGQPMGFLNSASTVNAGVAVGSVANDGIGGANTLGTIDFANLLNAVDVAYRERAVWMCHPSTLLSLQAQVSKDGRPLYPGLHNSPDGVNRVLNRPLLTNPFMDPLPSTSHSPQVTSRPIALGDFSRYTVKRGPLVVFRLEERYAERYIVGVLGMQRADANFTDLGPCCAYLQTIY